MVKRVGETGRSDLRRLVKPSIRPGNRIKIGGVRIWRFVPLALIGGLVAFFALRPSSNPADLPWMPTWLAWGGDQADAWRNVGAYFLLTLAALIALPDQKVPVLVLLGLLVPGLEALQGFLPDRWLEWTDILLGWAGVAAGAILMWLFRPAERGE